MSDASVGTAFVDFRGDFSGLSKEVSAFLGPLTAKFGKLGAAGAAGLGVVAGGAVAAGAALYDVGEQFDQAYDTIRVKTGATDKELETLKRDFRGVVADVPADFADAGTAVGELNQRLDLTGGPLQRTAKRVLELSRLTETDLSTNIAAITRLFGDWGIETEKQPKTLDKLWRASQETGIEIGSLAEYMVQFGSPLRQMGFDFDTAAAMFSKFEKEGVNLQSSMPGLRMALKNFSAEGKDPAEALELTIDRIKGAASTAEANTLAFDVFGQKAGPDLAAAAREGRFDFDELIRSISGGKDTILGASRDTADFTEHWEVFRNRALLRLEPVAERVFGKLGDAMDRVGSIMTDGRLTDEEKFSKLSDLIVDSVGDALPGIAEKAGQGGAILAEGMVKGFVNADTFSRLVIGVGLIRLLGGRGALLGSGAAVGRLLGIGLGAGAASAAVGGAGAGAVGGAAAGGLVGGIRGKLQAVKWGRIGGLGLGLALADATFNEFARRAQARSDDLGEALKGASGLGFWKGLEDRTESLPFVDQLDFMTGEEKAARNLNAQYEEMLTKRVRLSQATLDGLRAQAREVDLTKESRAQLDQMLEVMRAGRALRVGVDLGMDPAKLQQIRQGFRFLKGGIGDNMADINRVTKRTGRLIAATFGKDTKEGRKLAAENMRATAHAIKVQMERSGKETKEGWARIRQLTLNADLLSPTRQQAREFGREWAKGMDRSKEVTQKGLAEMIREAKKMPAPMRQVALQAWMEQIRQAKRSGDLTTAEVRKMRSRVLSEFGNLKQGGREQSKGLADGVIGNVDRLVNTTGSALVVLRENLSSALDSLGVEAQQFTIKTTGRTGQRRQMGGFIVPGDGDGDRPGFAAPVGSFVLNREATRAFGLRNGGIVPLALEAGERLFTPPEVARVGRDRLEAMNATVPRFQTGGLVEPRLAGSPGPLRQLGQSAVRRVYEGAEEYLKAHRPKGLGSAPGQLGAVEELAAQMGLQMTSGYRPGDDGFHGINRARDFSNSSGPTPEMMAFAKVVAARWGRRLLELIYSPLGWSIDNGRKVPPYAVSDHFDHVHVAMQRGGFLQKLIQGGLVQASVYGFGEPGTGTQGYRGDYLPGHQAYAELEMGTALGGLPYKHPLRISRAGKAVVAPKLDIGAGGPSNPKIDLWADTARALGLASTFSGKVRIEDAKGGAEAESDEHTYKEDVPATYRGVRTDSLSFGSMPKSLQAIAEELRKRRAELRRYRSAAAHAKKENRPAVEQAIRKNITALEGRVHQLEAEQKKLRMEKAKRKFSAKLSRKLAKLTGFEDLIAGRERAWSERSQLAEQLVAMEPTQPQLPSSATDAQRQTAEQDYVARLRTYIEERERPAYADVLGTEADWRNTILRAERVAAGQWEGGSIGGLEGGWEGGVHAVHGRIEEINAYTEKVAQDLAKWRREHPGVTVLPDWLRQAIAKRDHMRERLPLLRHKEAELRKVVGEAREMFYPGGATVTRPAPPMAGSGSFEDALQNVQGMHWPDHHEFLEALPGKREAGRFGGAIWDTQTAIEELGLKIKEAEASLGAGEERDTEREAALEKLLREANQRNIARGIEEGVFGGMPEVGAGFQLGGLVGFMPPYAGKAHTGAVVPGPPTQEKTMIVRGKERIRTPEQEIEMAESIRDLTIGGDGATTPPLVIEKITVHKDDRVTVRFEGREFEAAVERVTGRNERRSARGAGRRLAGTAGVFG